MKEIISALRTCRDEQLPCVVATIIRVDGSAYRKEGARCIIQPNGDIIGILSGGCIEEDIREHAYGIFQSGRPQKLYYDFRAGEDDLWGLGIGCNGAITVWLELFDPVNFPAAAEAMLHDYEARAGCTAAYYAFTVMTSEHPGAYASGQRWNVPAGVAYSEFALPDAQTGIAEALIDGKRVEALVETIQPVPRLTIIGVGADVELLSQMAKMMEWHVRIVYHETSRAVKERFPAADELHYVPRADFSGLPIPPRHYVVVMTHNLELDQEAVKQLLPQDSVAYIGVLGSRSRIRKIVDFAGNADDFHARWLQKLHAPIGLDIGAKTPQEITLSIMAEMIAHWNGRNGESMRNTLNMGMSFAFDSGKEQSCPNPFG
ncbi:XdhC family protein [Paenibacillus piri]|uniref:XdhC/CoxI family protein n=1 Tax=Paenibacillus piri TaxID=2547395 RepID=A0A4R5KAF8_9BACL|nr:XdhC/CoxI family protein [Paenibacillus piri]TDF92016.1 XdhC/CoxI family protein [Paenibacillus piri]